MTVSVVLLFGATSDDVFPPIEKSCASLPLFSTLKTTVPCGTLAWESVNLNSVAVTVTVAALFPALTAGVGAAPAPGCPGLPVIAHTATT